MTWWEIEKPTTNLFFDRSAFSTDASSDVVFWRSLHNVLQGPQVRRIRMHRLRQFLNVCGIKVSSKLLCGHTQ